MGNAINVNHWSEDRLNYIIECTKKAIEVGKFKDPYAIISVGSGTGKYEKIIMEKCFPSHVGNPELICVDKMTESYSDEEMVINPHFSDVDSLLEAKPELVQNCILMLFWPYDQMHMDEFSFPTQTPYDIDAIVKLKPRSIVIMYEEFGGAGSHQLHAWLSNYTYLHSNLHYYEDIDNVNSVIPHDKYQYKFIKKNKWQYGNPCPLHLSEKSIICGLFVLKDDINEPYSDPRPIFDIPDEKDIELCAKMLSKCNQKAICEDSNSASSTTEKSTEIPTPNELPANKMTSQQIEEID